MKAKKVNEIQLPEEILKGSPNTPNPRSPEALAQWVINNRWPKGEYDKVSDFEMYHQIVDMVEELLEDERNKYEST